MPAFQLHHGDCLQVLPTLPDASLDLIVTSPPYNLGIQYRSFDDKASRSDFLDWCQAWAAELKRTLDDKGSFFLNVGASPSNPLLPHQLVIALTDGHNPLFVLQNTFHWIKSITVETRGGDRVSAGHFKPINSPRYVNDCHEYLFHLTKCGNVKLDRRAAGVPYQDKSNIDRWGHSGGIDRRCRGNNWFIPYDTIVSRNKERPHPASFPITLVEQCILLHGKGKETRLLDPFLGIGSSALAAKRQDIAQFTGIELDDYYLSVARSRLEEKPERDLFL
ncbi:MAG: site-specific DNA-methyltransferase [Verrucomicrobia bacterium]|nr:MAG: site-specific DNA-methyltransferase [Verrucomicrobiota bacterium]TAE88920.1 MAG: site-specific DNA-methyltransferase [Verrucomicrobiota bacterium]TAF27336.1 MAG: site-specific DNA-methyltransferase [Verrucomicrobiota bacterium]TAF42373.1 MAG: site-specific DNA-methyltransferase [Verrucomicrobiota bacterium]